MNASNDATRLLAQSQQDEERAERLMNQLENESKNLAALFREQAVYLSILEAKEHKNKKLSAEIEYLKLDIGKAERVIAQWPEKFAGMKEIQEESQRHTASRIREFDATILQFNESIKDLTEKCRIETEKREKTRASIESVRSDLETLKRDIETIHCVIAGFEIQVSEDHGSCVKKYSEARANMTHEGQAICKNNQQMSMRLQKLKTTPVQFARETEDEKEFKAQLKSRIADLEEEIAHYDSKTFRVEEAACKLESVTETSRQYHRQVTELVKFLVQDEVNEQNEALSPLLPTFTP